MINDTIDQLKPRLSQKWQAFFRKNREKNAGIEFPGMRRSRAPRPKVAA